MRWFLKRFETIPRSVRSLSMVIVKVVMSAGCRCQAAQSFAERLTIANRHYIVQYRIDGRREEIKTPCHFQKELVSAVGWHSYCNCKHQLSIYLLWKTFSRLSRGSWANPWRKHRGASGRGTEPNRRKRQSQRQLRKRKQQHIKVRCYTFQVVYIRCALVWLYNL